MSHLPLSLMNRLISNQVCCFRTLDAVFPKDLFPDYSNKPVKGLSFMFLFPFHLSLGDLSQAPLARDISHVHPTYYKQQV